MSGTRASQIGRWCWKCNTKTSGRKTCSLLRSCFKYTVFDKTKTCLFVGALIWPVWEKQHEPNLRWKEQITIIQLSSFEIETLQYIFSMYVKYFCSNKQMRLTQETYPVTFSFILNTFFKCVIYRNGNIYWLVVQGWYSGQFCQLQ